MSMPRRTPNFQHWACCLLAAAIPFQFIAGAVSVWLLAIAWLAGGHFRDVVSDFRRHKILLLWPLFFLLHALSYFWSTDKAQAVFDLTTKLSFVLLPLLLTGYHFTRVRAGQVILYFSGGLAFVALYCITRGLYRFIFGGGSFIDALTYHHLVTGFSANAVYMAWYAITALFLLLFGTWQAHWQLVLRNIFTGIIALFFILLSARLLSVLAILLLPVAYFSSRRTRIGRVNAAAALLSLTGIIIAIAATQNPIQQRFEDVFSEKISESLLPDYKNVHPPSSNLTIRVFMWRAGLHCMREPHLWLAGSGAGDTHLLLNNRMAALHIEGMDAEPPTSVFYNLDLHNMYLETLVMLGIPGLTILLCIVFMPLVYWKRAGWGWKVFILASAVFFLEEAALQTQAGIIFFTLFSVLYWRHVKSVENESLLATALPHC